MPDPEKDHRLSIEQAITSYIAYHHRMGHEAKTLEWHQIALGQFRKYVQVERHLLDAAVRLPRRTFGAGLCSWLKHQPGLGSTVRQARLKPMHVLCVPFAAGLSSGEMCPCSPNGEEFPRTSVPLLPHLVQPEERLMRLVQARLFPEMPRRERRRWWLAIERSCGCSLTQGSAYCQGVCLCVSDLDTKDRNVACEGMLTTVYNCARIKLTIPRDGCSLWNMRFIIPTGGSHDQEQDSEQDTRISRPRQIDSRHCDQLGIARNTVRKYLRHPELAAMPHPRPNRRSKLDPFKEQVKKWITEDHCYNCEAMLPRLLEQWATREA